jgi:hypothetical protein
MSRSILLALTSLLLCVGCRDAPKVQNAVAAELPECRVGDTCKFRPGFGSALVFTNVRAYDRFRRSKLKTPDESYQIWRNWEAKGDLAGLLGATHIRVLREVEGGVEAMVEADDYRPAPNGGIGMVGTKIAAQGLARRQVGALSQMATGQLAYQPRVHRSIPGPQRSRRGAESELGPLCLPA